jgi:hypothetical protein
VRRDIEAVKALKLTTDDQVREALQDRNGLTKVWFALDPAFCPPDVNCIDDVSTDLMHVFHGISRKEGGVLLRVLFKTGAGLVNTAQPLAALNASILALHLPNDKRISSIPPFKPNTSIAESKLELNAAETMRFVLHSVQLLEPLLTGGLNHLNSSHSLHKLLTILLP